MKKCDHVIGFSQPECDDGSAMLFRLSNFYSHRDWPDEEFKFCSDCGAELNLEVERKEAKSFQAESRDRFNECVATYLHKVFLK